MKKNDTVDADTRLDALLAGMPAEPSADFSARVRGALADEIVAAKLGEMPCEPSPEFSSRVMLALESERAGTLTFPPRRKASLLRFVRAAAAGTAAAVALSFGFVSLSAKSLSEQVAGILESTPELAQLASADDDLSLGELVEAARLLAVLQENSAETAELFTYYEN